MTIASQPHHTIRASPHTSRSMWRERTVYHDRIIIGQWKNHRSKPVLKHSIYRRHRLNVSFIFDSGPFKFIIKLSINGATKRELSQSGAHQFGSPVPLVPLDCLVKRFDTVVTVHASSDEAITTTSATAAPPPSSTSHHRKWHCHHSSQSVKAALQCWSIASVADTVDSLVASQTAITAKASGLNTVK